MTKAEQDALILGIDKLRCPKYLYYFVERAWKHAFGYDFIDGMHIGAICYHLQALWEGQMDTLLINVPPGTGKSSLASVMLPAWIWTHTPQAGMWFASFEQNLCDRDSVHMRNLITSDWYQTLWGESFKLMEDQNQKRRYDNDKGGWRLAASVGAKRGFGEHPELFLLDDPLDPEEAASEVSRQRVLDYWTDKISTRGIVKGVKRCIVMQRLHENDPTGHVKNTNPDAVHLYLPMEFEKDRVCSTPIKYRDIKKPDGRGGYELIDGWRDPRTEEGQLLWPECLDATKVQKFKSSMRRAHVIAGQLQQRPTAPEGDMFRYEWFQVVEGALPQGKAIRAWDKASATNAKADFTVGVLVVDTGEGYYVVDVIRGKWGRSEREDIILQAALRDREQWPDYEIHFEQEGSSGAKDAIEQSASELSYEGFRVKIGKPLGKPKKDSAGHYTTGGWEAWCAALEGGRVKLVKGTWNSLFIDEHCAAPHGHHDDQIDAAARAVTKLSTKHRAGHIGRPLLLLSDTEQQQLESKKTGKELCTCVGLGCEKCHWTGFANSDPMQELLNSLALQEESELGIMW